MEDNLQNDRFEEFLKKSFENFQENPPESVWTGMEEFLPKAPPVKPWLGLKGWIIAAALTVGALFVAQHLYYRQELSRMSNAIEHVQEQAESLRKHESIEDSRRDKQNNTAAKMPAAENRNAAENSVANKTAPETAAAAKTPAAIQAQSAAQQQTKTAGKEKSGQADHKGVTGQPGTPRPADTQATTPEKKSPALGKEIIADAAGNTPKETAQQEMQVADQVHNPTVPPADNEAPASKVTENKAPVAESALQTIGSLDLKKVSSEFAVVQPEIHVKVASLTKHTKGNLMATGLRFSALSTTQTISSLTPPDHGMGNNNMVATDNKTNGQTLTYNAFSRYQLGKGWSVEAGLGYRDSKSTSTISHQLHFMDRSDHDDPHGHHENHEFQYNLYTPSGVIAVRVQTEQNDPDEDISEDETLNLAITTHRRTQYVVLPVSLGKQFGTGRFRFNANAGVVVNYLAKNNVGVTNLTFDSPKLHPQMGAPPQSVQSDLNQFSLDYQASVGLEYYLSPALSLELTPSYMGSLTSRHSTQYVSSKESSFGLGLAATYHF